MGKVYNAIMGLVVGDVLGLPVKHKERGTYKVESIAEYKVDGIWSDCSSMTLATLESMVRLKKIDYRDIMNSLNVWCRKGAFTANGKTIHISGAVWRAIEKFNSGCKAERCGSQCAQSNSNEALIRMLPTALITDNSHLQDGIINIAHLTHAHYISDCACLIYSEMIRKILAGMDKYEAVCSVAKNWKDSTKRYLGIKEYYRLSNIENLKRDDIKSTRNVVDTLEAVVWCLLNTDSYRDCIIKAINLGGDTNAIAAVAGSIAGLSYGMSIEKGIPSEWIEIIPLKEWIKHLCDDADKIYKVTK